jgi:O-antigen/teichoic acid export membrane protein
LNKTEEKRLSHKQFNDSSQLQIRGKFLKLSPLMRGAALFGSSSVIAQGIMMLYSLLLARWLLPENYGIIAGCYSTGTLSAFLINWGMDTWLLHQGAIEVNPTHLARIVLKIKGILGIVWTVGVWLVLTTIRPDVYWPSILAVVILDIWLDSAFNTQITVLNITHRIRTVSVLMIASRGLRLLSAIGLILIHSKGLLYFSIARLACTIILLLIATIEVKSYSKSNDGLSIWQVWKSSLQFGLSEFLSIVYGQIDVTMVTIILGSLAVGYYSPAISLINALITALSSAYVYFIPPVSYRLANAPRTFRSLAIKMLLLFFIAGCLLSIGLFSTAGWLIPLLLNNAYQTTGDIVRILSPILLFKALSMGCAVILVAAGWQKRRLIPQIISASANILLNLWAIPKFGIGGAAQIYVLSEVILLAGYAWWVIIFFKERKGTWDTEPLPS